MDQRGIGRAGEQAAPPVSIAQALALVLLEQEAIDEGIEPQFRPVLLELGQSGLDIEHG